jgi:LPXTG-site transpeptidase (sortase) family protein
MRRAAAVASLALVIAALVLRQSAGFAEGGERTPGAAPSLADQVYYLGRDPATGRAATVGDRFIAQVRESFANYYVEDGEPVPPPPAEGADIAAIAIPALGVAAPVRRFGLDAAGRLDVPQDSTTVGWNPAYASLPGAGGATFLAAHYEYRGAPGVFFRLASIREGDEIALTLTDGSIHRYRVASVVEYALEAIDMGALLRGREGVESITLMTCSGPGDGGRYPSRTVVLAERIGQ